MADKRRGGGQNVGGGTVIALQPDYFGVGKIFFKAQNVFDFRSAPGIDRLVVVADAAQVAVFLADQTEKQVLDYLDKSYIAGLSLLGGEPFEHVNQQGLLPLLRKVKARFPEKNIWSYTGYDFEKDILGRMAEQWEETKEMLSYIDVLVDGEFKEALKSPSLQFKGSSNQRIIEVQPSLKEGHIVLWEPKEYVHVEVREN